MHTLQPKTKPNTNPIAHFFDPHFPSIRTLSQTHAHHFFYPHFPSIHTQSQTHAHQSMTIKKKKKKKKKKKTTELGNLENGEKPN
jgi:hypothetical protein